MFFEWGGSNVILSNLWLPLRNLLRLATPEFLRVAAASIVGRFLAFFRYDRHKRWHYSQEGEDIILARLFEHQKKGFYVDIGAHHPRLFSNTRLLAEKGWRGINVDPLPGVMKLFRKERPHDINLEIGISNARGFLSYYMFNEPALNSFSLELSLKRHSAPDGYRILKKIEVETRTLSDLFEEHLGGNEINVLTIDVEGHEMEVLHSNNWQRYRPEVILIESLWKNTGGSDHVDLMNFMTDIHYGVIGQTMNTLFFRRQDF